MKVIHRPDAEHHCNPGWERHWHEQTDPTDPYDPPTGTYLQQLRLPPGSVVECDCGQVWIAYAMRPDEQVGLLMHRIRWRKPTWRERRRLARGGSL